MPTNALDWRRYGPIYLLVLTTLAIWVGSKWYYGDWFSNPCKYPAKAASLTSITLMCAAVLLSTRIRPIESFFLGLDKVYQVHKRIGQWAFFIIIFHPLFLAADKLPDLGKFLGYMWFQSPKGDPYIIGLNFGVAVFLLMALLIALTLWIKPPYGVWKKTHEWFGLVVVLAVTHILVLDADVAKYPVLRVWVYLLLLCALGGFVYIRFLYRFVGPRAAYTVSEKQKAGDILELTFMPREGKMDFKPSQFVYLKVHGKGISSEPHPFSIASGYNLEARLKLGIRQVGDYTRSLDLLEPGDPVTLYGPYGRFSEAFLSAERDCVFIGGGIGITPFLGMWHVALHSEERLPKQDVPERLRHSHPEIIRTWKSPRVHLYYVCRSDRDASFDKDIRQEISSSHFHGFGPLEKRGHHYETYISSGMGRFSAQYVIEQGRGDLRKKFIFICGPHPMMESLVEQFRDIGVGLDQIIIEEFNLL